MKSFKPVLFGLILGVISYIYFRDNIGIAVGAAFLLMGICFAFLSSEGNKMKERKAAQKAAVEEERKRKEEEARQALEEEQAKAAAEAKERANKIRVARIVVPEENVKLKKK